MSDLTDIRDERIADLIEELILADSAIENRLYSIHSDLIQEAVKRLRGSVRPSGLGSSPCQDTPSGSRPDQGLTGSRPCLKGSPEHTAARQLREEAAPSSSANSRQTPPSAMSELLKHLAAAHLLAGQIPWDLLGASSAASIMTVASLCSLIVSAIQEAENGEPS